MKFIFSFLFGILLISPVFADCDENTPQQDCTCANWGWDSDNLCHECLNNEYSAEGVGVCTTITDTSTYYKNNEGSNVSFCPNQLPGGIIEKPEVQTYIGTCECTGNTPRHLIHSYNGNTHFYYCGICGFDSLQPFKLPYAIGDLYECNCAAAHANHVYGSTPASNNGTRSECACAKDANGQSILTNGLCMCGSGTTSQDPYSSTNNGITTYSCCPGRSTYNSTTGNCECNIQYARKTYDNNNKLTTCECAAGSLSNNGNKCVCPNNNQILQFTNSANGPYLSSCNTCLQNSQPTSGEDPRFCKCDKGYYQDHESDVFSNPLPACHQCPTQTQTPFLGSVGPESCRLKEETTFSISNTHTRSMKLIPQGATILPIYTDPYVQNNNNAQSQYTH